MRQRHCVSGFTSSRNFKSRISSICLCLTFVVAFPWQSVAQEPAKEFIEALRGQGYYDLALQYLDDIEKGSLIDESFRQRIPLEKAETLIQSVNKIRDLEKWETRLNQAQQILTNYVGKVSDPELVATTQQYQANLSYRQGRVYLKRSELDRLTATEKETQLSNARERLEKSLQEYLAAQESVKKILSTFKIDPENVGESTKKRDNLRRMFVAVKMRAPIVRETLADTYTNETKKVEQLKVAAKEFGELWNKYYNHNRREALDSCYYAARTNFKLKEYKEALSFTDELLNLPHQANSRTIIRKGAIVALDCWNAMEKYPINQIIAAIKPHVESLDRKSLVHPEWLQIQLELAKAYRARAEDFKAKNRKPSEVSRWNNEAAKLARTVSRSPSPVRDESRKLLTEWNIKVDEIVDEEKIVKTFQDAKEKTRELANELEVASVEVSSTKAKLRSAKDDAVKSELSAELDLAINDLVEKSDLTLAMVDKSLKLADPNIPREEINLIRYLQCYSYYASERYFESAIIGEFMLDHYPNVDWSQQAAGLVVKSYSRLYDSAPADQKDFESQQLSKVCDNIIRRWPGSPEAINSASKLANISIIKKDFTAAQKYLATIPSDHPVRASISLKVGSNLWSEYRKDSPKNPEKLANVVSLLTEGVTSSDPNKISFTTAVGSLRLVQAHLANNDSEKALHQLEKAKIAPLDLIKQQNPAIVNSQFRETFSKEAYRTAINTYLATLQTGEFDDAQLENLINKCLGTLQSLKQILDSEGDEGKKQLVATYKFIAARLNRLFESIEGSEKKIAMASSIGKLLGSLAKDATDGRTVMWAGATTLAIANQLGDDEDEDVRRSLYLQADNAFNRSGNLGFAGDPEKATMKLELGRYQALSKRGAGKYQAAVDALVEVLEVKPNYLQAQLDAAETLYQWGKAEGRANAFAEALGGKVPYRDANNKRRNRIWGWQQMVQMTQRQEKMLEVYYEVKYGQIRTMFEYWQATDKAKALEAAKRDISNFRKRYPEMGGKKWQAKFEALEERINSEAN